MGCDIHLMAEARKRTRLIERIMFWKKPSWKSIDKWVKEPDGYSYIENPFYKGRNYNLFCALCGVRSYHFYDEPPIISEPRGIPTDASKEVKEYSEQWGSDGHSHNYNTLKELKEFDWSSYGETVSEFRENCITRLEGQGYKDTDIRIVYLFDN